jgi:hypothetical protein
MTPIKDTTQYASKLYPCDACAAWHRSGYGQQDVSEDDWLIIEGAKADKWKILKGEQYRKIVYKDGGEFVTYRARIDMDALCLRLKLFDD